MNIPVKYRFLLPLTFMISAAGMSLGQNLETHSQRARQDEVGQILRGIGELTPPETVAGFFVIGKKALPVLSTPRTGGQTPFVVLAKYGTGRLVLLDRSYCDFSQCSDQGQNKAFFLNLVQWATGKAARGSRFVVDKQLQGWYRDAGFGERLKASGDVGFLHVRGAQGNPDKIEAILKGGAV